jgi:hypothetical protein
MPDVSGGYRVERTDDGQKRGDYNPYKVHNERGRLSSSLVHTFEKNIPAAIVLREDNEGR